MTALFTAWGVSLVLFLVMPVMMLVTMICALICVVRLGKVLMCVDISQSIRLENSSMLQPDEDDALADVAVELDEEQRAAERRIAAYDRARGAK